MWNRQPMLLGDKKTVSHKLYPSEIWIVVSTNARFSRHVLTPLGGFFQLLHIFNRSILIPLIFFTARIHGLCLCLCLCFHGKCFACNAFRVSRFGFQCYQHKSRGNQIHTEGEMGHFVAVRSMWSKSFSYAVSLNVSSAAIAPYSLIVHSKFNRLFTRINNSSWKSWRTSHWCCFVLKINHIS